ncbi:MAG: hypothetical protein JSS32_02565 [Verrucomicrobia bacterium]|nr:hypothetical protein [Verrucomicrobiota bacterium]
MESERFFFGLEIEAPWPDLELSGRILSPENRHMTLVFLGDVTSNLPPHPFTFGLAGYFNEVTFLPHREPRVVAWKVEWLEEKEPFFEYQAKLAQLIEKADDRKFLPHVTMARAPFEAEEWKIAFQKIPLFAKSVAFYQSLGHSCYKILQSQQIPAPFKEIEHTADIAFIIRGKDLIQLHLHAQLALSFHFPQIIDYFSREEPLSLSELVIFLNQMIARADAALGCPFKAVSYHGEYINGEWEMIVDV